MQAPSTIVVVEDEPTQRRALERWLTGREHRVVGLSSGEQALEALRTVLPDVVLLDIQLGGVDGLEVLDQLHADIPKLPVVMLTIDDSVESVMRAVQAGAFDYLVKPIDRRRLFEVVDKAIAHREQHIDSLRRTREGRGRSHGMAGESEPMRALFRQIDRVGPSPATVVIRGESGTGKELVARALHEASPRRDGPFVALSCAAIPPTLIDSELFGHERGAFTGAERSRVGRLEQANHGTLFLDEVAELSPAAQSTLLRALQERRFYRVGGSDEVQVELRVVVASHRDLHEEVEAGRFREDLFYRLAVVELQLPPLRDRGSDILLLARAFLAGLGGPALAPSAEAALLAHTWPGNVRELHNAMQRASVLAEGERIEATDLPDRVRSADGERAELARALAAAGGNVNALVEALGIPRSTLYRRLKQHGLK